MIKIELLNEDASYLSGDEVRGTLQWDFRPETREILRLEMRWKTQGKGYEDAEIVKTETIYKPSPYGSHDFAFRLPEGPYSFSGELISVVWMIEAFTETAGDKDECEFIVSPTRKEIILPAEAPGDRTKACAPQISSPEACAP